MKTSSVAKILVSLVLLGTAVFLFIRLRPTRTEPDGDAYFYDLQEHKLFTAPRGSIPPIPGVKGGALAGVRAIVIATNGNPADKPHLQIAYLEQYSPEIKQLFEEVHQARAAGRSEEGRINRREVVANTLVRRLGDTEWHALNSPEGEKIATEWNVPGPDGQTPVVCSP